VWFDPESAVNSFASLPHRAKLLAGGHREAAAVDRRDLPEGGDGPSWLTQARRAWLGSARRATRRFAAALQQRAEAFPQGGIGDLARVRAEQLTSGAARLVSLFVQGGAHSQGGVGIDSAVAFFDELDDTLLVD